MGVKAVEGLHCLFYAVDTSFLITGHLQENIGGKIEEIVGSANENMKGCEIV